MELYIRIKDGQPFEHPIFADNFRAAFPHIDTNNLPPEFARFERVPFPEIGIYEIHESTAYEKQGDVYTDVHNVRLMTEQEKVAKQDQIKAEWAERGFASWVFDEETCSFIPPSPHPDDGKSYLWNEETLSWELSDA